jgi:hypothetical protein
LQRLLGTTRNCDVLPLLQDIGILFIVGFGSSAVFGTFAGKSPTYRSQKV